jgi:hypothetical protein
VPQYRLISIDTSPFPQSHFGGCESKFLFYFSSRVCISVAIHKKVFLFSLEYMQDALNTCVLEGHRGVGKK